ncbi:MAG: hypothetical protein IH612_04120 [Desulfofustis sp.]|nr:hypothetical protein [Desulfofustis sp.]
MTSVEAPSRRSGGAGRTGAAACLLLGALLLLLTAGLAGADSGSRIAEGKYSRLIEMLGERDGALEFMPYTEFMPDRERTDHGTCVDYLQSRPDLIERIRDDLGCEEVNWQLGDMSYRLMYVPETREEVADLFVEYCREAIGDLLARTGLPDPYHSISTAMEHGLEPMDSAQGVKAIIVRDLAREYKARYRFSGDTEKRIDLDLSGRSSIDEVGSYSSYIHYSEKNDSWRFRRARTTIWKSVSDNPYTVLMTPLEETLHIVLRDATEREIMQSIDASEQLPTLADVGAIVERWMAVEEAVVGGLVHHLVPEVLITRIPELSETMIREDLQSKAGFDKYRLLPRAIEVVAGLGVKESVALFLKSPADMERLLQ